MVTRIIEDWARDHRIAFAHGFGRDADDFLSAHDRAVYVVWEKPRVGVTEISMRFRGVTQEERDELNMRLRRSGAVVEGQRVRVKIRRPYGQAGGVTPAPVPQFTGLKFTADTDGSTISITCGLSNKPTFEISEDGVNWLPFTVNSDIVELGAGESVYFRGDNNMGFYDFMNQTSFSMTGSIRASGDITSLINNVGGDAIMANKQFAYLFYNCQALKTAPNLPSTNLTNYCYMGMFQGCTALTESPVLPADVLATNSYSVMFANCLSLSVVTCLATDITATNATQNWLSGVSVNGVFKKSPSMTAWTTGVNGIPSAWSVEDYV